MMISNQMAYTYLFIQERVWSAWCHTESFSESHSLQNFHVRDSTQVLFHNCYDQRKDVVMRFID